MKPGSPLRTLSRSFHAIFGLAFIALAASGQAQDLCSGLVTDKAAHPMTALAKPAVGQAVTDPQFGTTIRRISAAPSGGTIKPMYSTISAWNADESKMILYRVGQGHQLYDGKTYQFIQNLDVNPADLEQIYWHTSDPDIFFYVDGNRFIRYHVSTGAKDTLTTFSFCSSASGGSDPMYISWDSKRIGLGCGSERFIYDISTNTVVGRKTLSGGVPQIAPSGTLAFLDGKVVDASLNTLRTLALGNPEEHASLGQLANGHDTYNGIAFDGSPTGTIVTFDLTDGTARTIVGPATGYPYPPTGTHVSAVVYKRPGWVAASIVGDPAGQGVLDNEIVLADTNPGGKVCRVAHHRSWGGEGSVGYWAEPHAVPSPSGTRILFGSDWGNSGTVDAFVVELPSYNGGSSNGDLSLAAGASPNPVAVGSDLTYTLTVRNQGTTSLSGVTLTDTLPAGAAFVSATTGCTNAAGTVTCALGTLAGSATTTVTIVVSADTVGTAVNQASVSSGTTDPNTSNNTASTSVPVVPTISIGDTTVTEGNSGTTTAQFTVSLSAGSSSSVTVAYATANGTATAGTDYVAKSGTLTFTSGVVQQTVTVTVNGDTTVEPGETFVVNLTSPTNAILSDAQGQGTITNDDSAPLPTLAIGDVTVTEGNSGTVNARFTVTLSAASASAVTVAYATADGTAGTGSDYVAKSGTLTFAAGTTQQLVDVTVNGDTTVESNETFFVNLSGPSGATIADGQGQGTITNDDSAPVGSLTVGDVSVTEGNSGTVNARFTVTLSGASSSAITVAYATANGTATAGTDYVAKSGTLTFAAGTTQQFVDVAVNGDTTVESNETFFVNLSSPSGATIADGQGQGTIVNDDAVPPPPPPVPTLAINDVTIAEGNSGTTIARFTATLSAASGSAVTVVYATANGTATAGSDYLAKSATLTFAAGANQQTIEVTVNGDTAVEPNETFVVNLSSPSGATIADSQGQGTISNDDAAAPGSGVPGDFNGDGQGDLLWHHQQSGDLYAWFMNGISAGSASYLTPSRFADVKWQIRGLADFNGDGRTDVLWHHQKTGELYVWMLNGTVTTAGSYLNPKSFSDTNWQIRATVDFNKDSKPDILWHHQKTGDLYVWFMNGTQVTAGAYLTPSRFADTKWQIRGTFDPNKDGEPDILWHHQGTGDLYLWFMKGTTAVSGVYLTPSRFTDTRWQLVRECDFNKDGSTDLLWHHQASGQLYVWYMTGTTATGGAYLNPPAFTDVQWKVMPR